jgi:hypothetical protein
LIPYSKVAHIEGIPPCATFWHTPNTHVYTNPIPGGLFEIATRALEGEEFGNKVQYGQIASREQVVPHYKVASFCLQLVTHKSLTLICVSGIRANYATNN